MTDKNKKNQSDNQSQISEADELKKCLEGWQRTQADLENFRRRTNEEKKVLHSLIKIETLLEITPAIDNFSRAFDSVKGKDEQWVAGIKQIYKQLTDILEEAGLEKIKTLGEKFDPTRHEALSQQPSKKPAETIIEEVESGYQHDGTIVKPARVILSAGGQE